VQELTCIKIQHLACFSFLY